MRSLWTELQRRKIVRVADAYAVATLVALQVERVPAELGGLASER